MKILITGSAGMIGAKLADYLVINGHDVAGIDDLSGGYSENINTSVQTFIADVRQPLREIFDEIRPTYVYHLAAYAAEALSPFIRAFNYENNVVGTARVVNECIHFGVERLVFASSIAVYGHQNIIPISEDHMPMPADPYGVAKLTCEMDIKIAGDQHGLDWCVLRPHNIYGPKQNIWDKYRNVIGIWMYHRLRNEPIIIFGAGEQKRAFTYIDDILPLIWQSSVSPLASKQIFNIGSNKEYSLNQLADIFEKVVGPCKREYIPARHEVKDAWCCHEKIKTALGGVEETSLEHGISKMWEWAQVQPLREQYKWNQYEIDKGMYGIWK